MRNLGGELWTGWSPQWASDVFEGIKDYRNSFWELLDEGQHTNWLAAYLSTICDQEVRRTVFMSMADFALFQCRHRKPGTTKVISRNGSIWQYRWLHHLLCVSQDARY